MKVLVVSNNPFSNCFNNGKTLESLFSWVPKESLAQLFFHASFEPDFSFCKYYYRISDSDVLKNAFSRRESGSVLINEACGNAKIESRYNKIRTKFNLSRFQLIRDYLWKALSPNKASLYTWIESFGPDIVFFVGGNCGFAHEVVFDIVFKYNVKLYTYFTDDYIIFPKYNHVFEKIQKRRLELIYDRTIRLSSYCFVIGNDMARVYSNKFNVEFIPIMNSVSIENYPLPAVKEKLIISYIGNIGLKRWEMIGRLAKEITALKNVSNFKCDIIVYSIIPSNLKIVRYLESVGVVFGGFVVGEKLKDIIVNSDILLHVESDDVNYRLLTKLSISTKIPEYLVTHRPILAFGPTEVASMNLLSNNNIGFVIDSESSIDIIRTQLKRILCDANNRLEIANNAFHYVSENFELHKVQSNFKKYFN